MITRNSPLANSSNDNELQYHIPNTDLDIVFNDMSSSVTVPTANQVLLKAYNDVVEDCMMFSGRAPGTGDFVYNQAELTWLYERQARSSRAAEHGYLYISTDEPGSLTLHVNYVKGMLKAHAWLLEEKEETVTEATFALYRSGVLVCFGSWNIPKNFANPNENQTPTA